MGTVKLYGRDKFAEDLRYYDIPAWGWFCKITGSMSRFFDDAADIRRYRGGLQKAAERESAQVELFTCRNGVAYIILCNVDQDGLRRIVRSANAGYGKYRHFLGETASFAGWAPVPIRSQRQRAEIFGKIFNILHVADLPVSDV